MNNVKVNLTILLPGSTMLSEHDCSKEVKKPVMRVGKNGKPYQMKDRKGNPKFVVTVVPDFSKMEHHEIRVTDKNNKLKEIIGYYTRGFKPAKQSLNINEDAYEYFISGEVPAGYKYPSDFKPNRALLRKGVNALAQSWMALSPEQKLEWHLRRICESRGGSLDDYVVFND